MPAKPKRRWFQYSLRTLMALVTLVAVCCSWYAVEMQKAAKRREAIEELNNLPGWGVFYYDAEFPEFGGQPPGWFSLLRRIHGDEHLGHAVAVHLSCPDVGDADIIHLEQLTAIENLKLAYTSVTDDGLATLASLPRLRFLDLHGTQVSDEGLAHLWELSNLEELWLDSGRISDAGLEHLKTLKNLQTLTVSGRQLTDEGIANLRKALPNCEIDG